MKYSKLILLISIVVISVGLFLTACDNRLVELPSYHMKDITANPDIIYADNSEETYSEIKVKIIDSDDMPISAETVYFSCSDGNIGGSAITNEQGLAIVNYHDVGEIATATITATYNGASLSTQVDVQAVPAYYIEQMIAIPDTIYADNNITFSTISLTVQDEDGFNVSGELVRFRSDIGNLITNVTTDSSGVAETTFWDQGEIGIATIQAFVGNQSEYVNVTIEDIPEITSLDLIINSIELNIDEVTEVRAVCDNVIGQVPDGTIITFETNIGYFLDEQGINLGTLAQASTSNGISRLNFNAGSQKGEATIIVRLGTLSDNKIIHIHPGSPKYMYLHPEVEVVQANSNEEVLITAQIEDRYHNAVESGIGVSFTTDLGTIIEFDTTDSLGFAETTFSPGISAGYATIEAIADSAAATTVISVISDDVYSIEFAFNGQVEIQVQGTGGQESYEFQVNLFDVNGNLIDYPETVWFRFINGPNGININNQVFMPGSDSLAVMSTIGEAIVSVSSGLDSGPVALEAYTFNDNGDKIGSVKSNIVVHSGPPNSVEISTSGTDSATDMGAGVWQIQCSALLNDVHGNPVDYGTAVWFSLPEDPDWAVINSAAYVGNENAMGDSVAGIAYTDLQFLGNHTNETLLVQVEVPNSVQGEPNYIANQEIVMPAQSLSIDIVAVPLHIDWWEIPQTTPEYLSLEVRITVKDGQNNPIDNQVVVFSTTLGEPLEPTPPDTGDPYTGITGEIDSEHGRLNKEVEFYYLECPAPIPTPPGNTTATITAQILGTNISSQVVVILRRYVD